MRVAHEQRQCLRLLCGVGACRGVQTSSESEAGWSGSYCPHFLACSLNRTHAQGCQKATQMMDLKVDFDLWVNLSWILSSLLPSLSPVWSLSCSYPTATKVSPGCEEMQQWLFQLLHEGTGNCEILQTCFWKSMAFVHSLRPGQQFIFFSFRTFASCPMELVLLNPS